MSEHVGVIGTKKPKLVKCNCGTWNDTKRAACFWCGKSFAALPEVPQEGEA